VWLRIFQHLLPQAQAWRITIAKTLRSFFVGLTGLPTDVRQFIDDVHDDLYPNSTRQLSQWEAQFGLTPSAGATDSDRRLHLTGAWQAQGGQSPSYLQSVVQAAGFPLYIYEWWDPTALPTITARDPRTYTNQPLRGAYVCRKLTDAPFVCRASQLLGVPQVQFVCTNWLNNEVHYLVNLNLTRQAPPPIPSDTAKWPFFATWCGSTYGTFVNIPAARRNELEALLKKLCPAQLWIVTLINYV
jgi:uncharacterized protein YmfQ (DUF2313 family)